MQTDIFNFGATMYWALCGKTIPTLYTVNKKGDNSLLSHELMQTPADLNPTVPPAAPSNLVMECVATNPKKPPGRHGRGHHAARAREAHPDEAAVEPRTGPGVARSS